MKYYYELTISSSPHVHSTVTTKTIMRDVLISLVPALAGAVYFFGLRALMVTVVSVASCVFFEWLWNRLMKRHSKLYDLSACVTGVLLAFVCPPTIDYWMVILGAAFAILVVKMLFGGIGKNLVNPALAGRAFLFCWPVAMTTWVKPGFSNAPSILDNTSSVLAVDGMTGATPLSFLSRGQLPADSLGDMVWGNIGGCIGETSVVLLLAGFAYLLIRRVLTVRIPLAYIGTVAVLTLLFPQGGQDRFAWMAYQLCSGGLMLGALFMATDYVTSPITPLGQTVYGIGCGILTVVIRYFGGYNEGVSYAILVMNCCIVLFDRIGRPTKYGAPKKEAVKK